MSPSAWPAFLLPGPAVYGELHVGLGFFDQSVIAVGVCVVGSLVVDVR